MGSMELISPAKNKTGIFSQYPFGGGPPTITETTGWMPEQEALSQEFANYLSGGQWQQPATGYTGQMTAGWNPEQQQALQTYGNIAAGPGTPAFEAQRDVQAAPLRRILSEQTLPAMREQYGAQGLGLSTPLMQQELQARTGLEENVAAQLGQQQMGALQGLATQAGAKQTTEQTALANQYNEWLRTQPEYSPWLQTLMTYLQQKPRETIVTTR